MKNLKIYIVICVCLTGMFLFGCSDLSNISDLEINPEPTIYSVTYMSEGKTYERSVTQAWRVAVKPKDDPVKENHKFIGWYLDEGGDEPYDFTSPLSKSIILYAKFELDLEALNEKIANLKYSIVKVKNENYNMDGEEKTDSKIENGIGYIFNISGGYCYLVTNNHTVSIQQGYTNQKVTVEDYTGQVHDTYYYKNPNKPQRASSSDYDLAVICFKYNRSDLKVVDTKNNTLKTDDIIVSVGSTVDKIAHGTVTQITPYTADMEEYLSNIKFDVICHNAIPEDEMDESLLFNLDLSVAGLTYATEEGLAYTISYTKIQEFLYEFVYN